MAGSGVNTVGGEAGTSLISVTGITGVGSEFSGAEAGVVGIFASGSAIG